MTNKMYLQSDNGGNGILIQDIETNKWYYWSEYHLPINLDGETDEENAEIIRAAIENGDMYDADDFMTETDDAGEHEIKEYAGMNIEEIDHKENYVKDIYSAAFIMLCFLQCLCQVDKLQAHLNSCPDFRRVYGICPVYLLEA